MTEAATGSEARAEPRPARIVSRQWVSEWSAFWSKVRPAAGTRWLLKLRLILAGPAEGTNYEKDFWEMAAGLIWGSITMDCGDGSLSPWNWTGNGPVHSEVKPADDTTILSTQIQIISVLSMTYYSTGMSPHEDP